jgi:predicted cupin superfamily sugar epimerase
LISSSLTAADVVRLLDLAPHPEGGHFRETFRDHRRVDGGRAASTAIYFLLAGGERSHWHRIDAIEVWHFYAGAPLLLEIAAGEQDAVMSVAHECVTHGRVTHMRVTLGPDLAAGEQPQTIVPAGAWQAAESLGAWTLVGCTVSPGFEFERFELAPKGWRPG